MSGQNKMIEFHAITLADKSWMNLKFSEEGKRFCEYSFANNFLWRKLYQTEVASLQGCLIIRVQRSGRSVYSYPIGQGDKRAALEALLQREESLQLMPLGEEERRQLLDWFPGQFLVEGKRDMYDYIYDREKLVTLQGKKLHGKRNHIARFKDYADWGYEEMTEQNAEECRRMSYRWLELRAEKWSEEMEDELGVVHDTFDYLQQLELQGGLIRQEGEIVAFAIGEPLTNDTFVIHFEKAYPTRQGAYPMINQQFALHACEGYKYINREEDTGDPGLRKAKLSYYPEILLKKYTAAKSDIVYADPERDRAALEELWQTSFGDEREVIRLYFDSCMTEENMLVLVRDGKPVSMASFLPVEILMGEGYREARYVYAVATHPEYRGRGLAARLLTFAKKHYGLPLILAPAEQSLAAYYEAIGFHKAAEEKCQAWESSGMVMQKNVQWESLESAEEYIRLRREHCEADGFVRWEVNTVEYALRLNEQMRGRTLCITDEEGRRDLLMYFIQENKLCIMETTIPGNKLPDCLQPLMEEHGVHTAEYREAPAMLWLPEDEKTAPAAELYLGLTLG